MSREAGAPAQGRFLHAVSAIANIYPAVLTRTLLLRAIDAIQLADAVFRGRLLSTFADLVPRGLLPSLEEPLDLFTRLYKMLPSLLLEPEVEFIRGAKVCAKNNVDKPRVEPDAKSDAKPHTEICETPYVLLCDVSCCAAMFFFVFVYRVVEDNLASCSKGGCVVRRLSSVGRPRR